MIRCSGAYNESHEAEKFYARTATIDYPRLSNVVLRIANLMLFVFGVGGAVIIYTVVPFSLSEVVSDARYTGVNGIPRYLK
jgi:hypothetical protein